MNQPSKCYGRFCRNRSVGWVPSTERAFPQVLEALEHHYGKSLTCTTFAKHVLDRYGHYGMDEFPVQSICAKYSSTYLPRMFCTETFTI